MNDNMTAQKPARGGTYMVCVDGREECRVALRLACLKALARGGAVTLLHVIAPADFQTLGAIADRMREERLREANALMDALALEAKTTYGVAPTLTLAEGGAGDEIVQAAMGSRDVIMLVLGVAHQHSSRGKLASWLAGQLGGKLLIPLLMVPGNLTEEQLVTLI